MSKAKIIQSAKLYLQKQGEEKMRHVTNWPTFLKVCDDLELSTAWKDRTFLDDENFPPKGKPITEWPEKEPEVEIRKMAILGTCLPNTPTEHMKQIGFTHFIGNREGWPSHADVKAAGLKLFVNIHPYDNSVPTNAWIKEKVLEHKDKAYCGGFWSDSVGGEEPDARPRSPEDAKKCLADRIRFKEQVRLYAPDAIRWPVVEQFNQTEEGVIGGLWRPGWKNMYDERTLDILLHDCYTFSESDQVMKDNIRKSYSAFPGKYCKNVQVIPQMNAYNYRPGSIWTAYNAWVECLGKPMAVAFYKDETVRKNAEMQAEIKEVIHEAMNVIGKNINN